MGLEGSGRNIGFRVAGFRFRVLLFVGIAGLGLWGSGLRVFSSGRC